MLKKLKLFINSKRKNPKFHPDSYRGGVWDFFLCVIARNEAMTLANTSDNSK